MQPYSIKQRNRIIFYLNDNKTTEAFNFKGLKLLLSKDVLVPHPDTLSLIKKAEMIIRKNEKIKSVADVGTGSGIIALSLAKKFPRKKFLATDISKTALKVAENNAVKNSIKNIEFLLNTDGIWLSEIKYKKVDLLISNPPFVCDKEFKSKKFRLKYPETLKEPVKAVVIKDIDGFSPYTEIFKNSEKLKIKYLLMQCNSDTIKDLLKSLKKDFGKRFDFKVYYCNKKKRILYAEKKLLRLKRFIKIKQV